jgi:hypothetical protein
MKPLVPNTNKGRTVSRDDIHHRSADQPKSSCHASAKKMRHAARQKANQDISLELENPKSDNEFESAGWGAGWESYFIDREIGDNPYAMDTLAHSEWLGGFRAAKKNVHVEL